MSTGLGQSYREISDMRSPREESPAVVEGSRVVYNAMTVDVEDYFHVTNFEPYIDRADWPSFELTVPRTMDRIFRLFDDAGVRATFFVLGWVAERVPQVVRRAHELGHEIASHGYWHRRAFQHPPELFREDVRRSKAILEDLIGARVYGHRAPTFSIDQDSMWALDILLEEGYEYDSSLFPGRIYRPGFSEAFRYPHNIDRGDHGLIKEIPMTTLVAGGVKVPFAGGGFFRLYPYPLIRWGMKRINEREEAPVVVYFHPWELAPDQPRPKIPSMKARFKHYVNLASFESKIARLLDEFRFKTCLELLDDFRL